MAEEKNDIFTAAPVPELKAGRYTLKVHSQLTAATGESFAEDKRLDFGLYSPRFELTEKCFVYPPANANAHFQVLTLPKLTFNNTLFPFSRSPFTTASAEVNAPWLVLLTIPESAFINSNSALPEILPPVSYQLNDIDGTPGTFQSEKITGISFLEKCREDTSAFGLDSARLPEKITIHTPLYQRWKAPASPLSEKQEKINDPEPEQLPVTCLYIKSQNLGAWLPKADKLNQLIYTHQETHNTEKTSILSRSVLREAGAYRCYLLSLEHRYHLSTKEIISPSGTLPDDYQGFIVLKQWQFQSKGPAHDTAYIKEQLERIRLNEFNKAPVLLSHQLRNGQTGCSYFTPPLWSLKEELFLPETPFGKTRITTSDELILLRKNEYDITYASAWELGRLTGLDMRTFTRALLAYKQAGDDDNIKATYKTEIRSLFQLNDALNKVPVHYWLPSSWKSDEAQLSLFRFDAWWLVQFLKGLFSLGDDIVLDDDSNVLPASFFEIYPDRTSLIPFEDNIATALYGFIIKSSLIDDFPDLSYQPYSQTGSSFDLLLKRELDKDTTMYLYEGPVIDGIKVQVPSGHTEHIFPAEGTRVKTRNSKASQTKVPELVDHHGRIDQNALETTLQKVFKGEAISGKMLAVQIQTQEPEYKLSFGSSN